MSIIYDPIRDNGKQISSLFGNGLDESDVLLFVSSLIEQNSELMVELEQAESLIKLIVEGAQDAARQVESARAEIDRIASEARLLSEKTTHEQLSAAEEQAQSILKSARERAEAILRAAQDEASRIAFEARQQIGAAKRQAKQIVDAAEAEASKIKGRTEATGGNGKQPARACAEEEAGNREQSVLYSGAVELEIPPPVSIGRLKDLAKYLMNTRHLEVLALDSAPNHGLRIRIHAQKPLPLIHILKSLPQVERVIAGPGKNKGVQPSRSQPGNGTILVKMRN